MNQRTTIGPRGWAIITLAGGAALASPFLRPAQLKDHDDFSVTAAPSLGTPLWGESSINTALTTGEAVPASLPNALPARVTEGQLSSSIVDSRLATNPNATAIELPAWAGKQSQLDALITSGTAGSGVRPFGSQPDTEFLKPLTPWQNEPLSNEVQKAVDLEGRTLASSRHSPWQAQQAIAANPSTAPSTGTNWPIAPAADVQALLQANTPATQSKPGGLVGATLQRTTTPPTSQEHVREPKFVFQPGMKSK